jgi:hypothetical protein
VANQEAPIEIIEGYQGRAKVLLSAHLARIAAEIFARPSTVIGRLTLKCVLSLMRANLLGANMRMLAAFGFLLSVLVPNLAQTKTYSVDCVSDTVVVTGIVPGLCMIVDDSGQVQIFDMRTRKVTLTFLLRFKDAGQTITAPLTVSCYFNGSGNGRECLVADAAGHVWIGNPTVPAHFEGPVQDLP